MFQNLRFPGTVVPALIVCLFLALNPAFAERLTILHVNDTHTHLASWGPHGEDFRGTIGGYDRLATVVSSERQQDDELLLLGAGDNSGGDLIYNLFLGIPEFGYQKMLEFDAMTIGNHEFDLGPVPLMASLAGGGMLPGQEGAFPLLSANLNFALDTSGLANVVQTYTVVERHGIRVGIFGLTLPETMILARPFDPVNHVGVIVRGDTVEVLMGIAGGTAAQLRQAEQCDVVIALTHLGILYDIALAQNVPGIDLIIGGHQHVAIDTSIENRVTHRQVKFVASETALSEVGKVILEVDENGARVVESAKIPLNEEVARDDFFTHQIDTLVMMVEQTVRRPFYTRPVARAASYIPYRVPVSSPGGVTAVDCPLGNLISDALRTRAGSEFGLDAQGFLRQDIFEGEISEADIFQAVGTGFYPNLIYGYPLMTYQLTGLELCTALEYAAGVMIPPYNLEFLILPSGFSYSLQLANEPGHRLDWVLVDGSPIQLDRSYTLASSVALPVTMEQLFRISPHNMAPVGTSLFEAVRDYVVANSPVSAEIEGRVLPVAKEAIVALPPDAFELSPAYPNPFNATTSISFLASGTDNISLEVYDMTGRLAAILFEGKPVGEAQTVSWNASGLSTGSYIVKLRSENKTTSRTVTLLK